MNKVFEYMTLGIPFVGFDLIEGRKMAASAAIYAKDNCPRSLAGNMLNLLDNKDLRERTAAEGIARAKSLLRWDEERSRLLAAYETALGSKVASAARPLALPAHD